MKFQLCKIEIDLLLTVTKDRVARYFILHHHLLLCVIDACFLYLLCSCEAASYLPLVATKMGGR